MVKGRRSAADVLRIARRLARRLGYSVELLPKRGKGSHSIYVVKDADGRQLARLALTGHSGDMSRTVTRSVEQAGEPAFGKEWLDK